MGGFRPSPNRRTPPRKTREIQVVPSPKATAVTIASPVAGRGHQPNYLIASPPTPPGFVAGVLDVGEKWNVWIGGE